MDPVSAIGVAAAAVQFTEIAIKITNRIAVFTVLRDIPKHAEGPKAFVERLRSQLGLLNSTIRRIEDGLSGFKEGLQENELLELGNYISNLNRHGQKLDELLNKYLPNDDASTPARLLAALKSIASDIEIDSVMSSINELLPLLTTFLLTSMAFKTGFNFTKSSGLAVGTSSVQRRPNSGAIYQVSRHEVRHFVERPELIVEIDRCLSDGSMQPPRIVVLQGMGGQGKTQLALRYCGAARFQKNFHCTLWIDASTKASMIRGLEGIAEELNDSNEALTDTDSKIALVRRKLTVGNMPWLLVFDNYDDPTAFDLRDYVPKGPLGNVLVTSRSPDAERIGAMIRISGMTEDEAVKLLFKQLDTTEDETNRPIAAEIVRRLGYLPLAVDQAGAYIKTEGLPLANFLDHYERSAKDILGSVPTLWEYTESAPSQDGKETTDIAKTVFTTWNLSFTLLKPTTPLGALKVKVLSLLAFFDEHEILEEYFKEYYLANLSDEQSDWMSLFTSDEGQWSSRKFDSVMREFSRLSLITSLNTERKDIESAIMSLHPLVRDWINLRQDINTYKTNFGIFTRILAATLLPRMWEEPSSFKVKYELSNAQSRRFAGHVISWMRVFREYKSELHPTVITPLQKGFLAVTTAERLIATYLNSVSQFDIAYELAHWLWDSCDVSNHDMTRVKFDIGNQEIICLRGMGFIEEAKESSREKLQYWRTIIGPDNPNDEMLSIALEMLIQSLNLTVSKREKQEVLELCMGELERIPNNEKNLYKRHTLLSEALYAAETLGKNDICRRTFDTMMEEMRKYHNNSFREINWASRSWYDITWYSIRCCDDPYLVDELSLAALEWAEDKFGASSADYVMFHVLRGQALAGIGKLAEAETMHRECALMVMEGSFDRSIYSEVYEKLGSVLHKEGRYEEAYEANNLALLQAQGPKLHINILRILNACGEAARWFNLELANAHLSVKYSLIKETDARDEIVNDIARLSQIKSQIGTETSAREALGLLVEGLEVYGIDVTYFNNTTPRAHLKDTDVSIYLDDPELLRNFSADSEVSKLLNQQFGMWHGFALLIRIASLLFKTGNFYAAEQTFQLSKAAFEHANNCDRDLRANFVAWVYHYTESRYGIDGDKQRVRHIMDWAKLYLDPDLPMVVDQDLSLSEWHLCLLELTESTAEHAKRKSSEMMHRLSGKFSRALSLKPHRSSRSLSILSSSRKSIRSTHSIARSAIAEMP
ncbi:uncharacterized protein F4822DRAFT_411176 [Hypoxylon trugodes]|uniref:uncharacterized protein n=1 Tax=Hypoxylon trugodes TaxID=326681 RepID=UPI0021957BDF|nr:uncharacterized protein F4822DRAFT_411176 [Hypoxylon trugodes]KAI1386773.1 hypothetical protein F4822DRAFT_411176 [Hypoxylon trugodes]